MFFLFYLYVLFFSLSYVDFLVNKDEGWEVFLKEFRYLDLMVVVFFLSLERYEKYEVIW